MIDLAVALRAVVEALQETGSEDVVVSSTAAAAWGVARVTRDVDVVAVVAARDAAALIGRLDAAGLYVPAGEVSRALAGGGAFNVLHPRSGGKVDMFVVSADDAFMRSRLDRRVRAATRSTRDAPLAPHRRHASGRVPARRR